MRLFHAVVDANGRCLAGFFDADLFFGAIAVRDALGGCGARAFCFDGNARCCGVTGVAVSLVVASTDGIDFACAGLGDNLADAALVGGSA